MSDVPFNKNIKELYKKFDYTDKTFFIDENLSSDIKKILSLNGKKNVSFDLEIKKLFNFYSKKLKYRTELIDSFFDKDVFNNKEKLLSYLDSFFRLKLDLQESDKDILLKEINNIKDKFLGKNTIKNILIVDLNRKRYFDYFIVEIFSFYAAILDINLSIFYLNEDNSFFYDNYIVDYKNYFNNFNFSPYKKDTKYDLVVLNNIFYQSEIKINSPYNYEQDIKSILNNSGKNLIIDFHFSEKSLYEKYGYITKKNIQKTDFFTRYNSLFFSRIIAELNNNKQTEYRYDIMIGGGVGQRNIDLIKQIVLQYSDKKILILTSVISDASKLIELFKIYQNVKIEINGSSYYGFYNYLNSSKIYLNCGTTLKETHGVTGLLCALASRTIVLTNKNNYYQNIINDNFDGFMYSNDDDCIVLLGQLLNSDKSYSDNIRNNRYNNFLKSYLIEDLIEKSIL